MWDHRAHLQNESLGLVTLKNLCLVSKPFCGVAQPLLYHHLSPFYWDWRHRGNPLILSFLRTIHQIPSLAKSTRELDIRYILPVETKDHRLPALLRTLASTRSGDQDYMLDPNSESELGNLLIRSLLSLTPNLEMACLGILPGWKFPSMAAGDHVKEGHALLSLKTLSLTGPAVLRNPTAFQGIDSLITNAPNLLNLRLQELTYCPPSSLLRKVRRLELCRVPLSCTMLKKMLQECNELEEFHYFGASFDAGTTEMGALGIEVVDALAPATGSLRCLEINYANHAPCIKNTHREIASLKQFMKLERLDLSTGLGAVAVQKYHQYFTFGNQSFADILPNSVKIFCPPCWPESILALAGSVDRREFPNLERIELEHGISNFNAFSKSSAWTRSRASFKRAFTDVSVDVSFAEDRNTSELSQWHVENEHL